MTEDRDPYLKDLSMDQVGLGIINSGPEKETLQLDAIDREHRNGIHKISLNVLDAGDKLVIKRREHVRRLRR